MALLLLVMLAVALTAGCSMGGNYDSQIPAVGSTSPQNGARGVPLNATLSVDFDRPMDPLSSYNFTVRHGSVPVSGVVSTSIDGSSATFTPKGRLSPNTTYNVTIGRDVTSADGTRVKAESNWSFTTGAGSDSSAPKVTSVRPGTGTHGAAVNSHIVVTFDEAMNPLTISPATFTVMLGTKSVSGVVSCGPGTIATFEPTEALEPESLYTVNVSAAATDLQGNRLASPVTWSFTTGNVSSRGPAAISLGSTVGFAIFTQSGVTNVSSSIIHGDIGLSASPSTALVGFDQASPEADGSESSPQVTGRILDTSSPAPIPTDLAAAATQFETAYTDAATRQNPDKLNLGEGNIGGLTLAPGLYKWTESLTISSDLILKGNANDVWIFQVADDLFVSSDRKILLEGANHRNVYWQVAGQTVIGSSAHFEGILLSKSSVTLMNGAAINGRILAKGRVHLHRAKVMQPASR